MDLEALLASWIIQLAGQRKSPHTIKTYSTGVRAYLAYLAEHPGDEPLSRDSVAAFTAHLLDAGAAPATALSRQAGVKRFSKWLAEAREISRDDLAGMKPPKVDEPVVDAVPDADIRRLLATCAGKEFHHVRDRAVIRFMSETGLRAAELAAMTTDDVNLTTRIAVIRRGKGGRGRLVRFSPQCAAAFDDYLRLRRRHTLASLPDFWLGARGRRFGYWGIYNALKRRGDAIGLADFHPHVLRNTAAVRWLKRGGTPTGLMAQAGWQSMDMLRRYIRAAEAELAAEEADRLGLGDLSS